MTINLKGLIFLEMLFNKRLYLPSTSRSLNISMISFSDGFRPRHLMAAVRSPALIAPLPRLSNKANDAFNSTTHKKTAYQTKQTKPSILRHIKNSLSNKANEAFNSTTCEKNSLSNKANDAFNSTTHKKELIKQSERSLQLSTKADDAALK